MTAPAMTASTKTAPAAIPEKSDLVKPDMADLPEQHAAAPASPAEARARFFNSGNAFNIKLPPVPGGLFTQEPERALAGALEEGGGTGFIACDQSAAMGTAFPATTPLMLARYGVVAPREQLAAEFLATGSIWYVIAGAGTADCLGETIAFGPGDVFLLPGAPAQIRAADAWVVLWVVSNEPQLALDGALPPDAARRPVAPVHYPAGEIARQVEILYDHAQNAATSGIALIFSSDTQAAARNILPSLTLSLNTLPGGAQQRAHRHNSAAITLVVRGGGAIPWWMGRAAPGRPGRRW